MVGVLHMDASILFPVCDLRELQEDRMPLQHIKDLISFQALFHYGGWFLDFDSVWTGLQPPRLSNFPECPGTVVFTSHEKTTGPRVKSGGKLQYIDGEPCTLNLGVLLSLPAAEFLHSAGAECRNQKAAKIQRLGIDGRAGRGWNSHQEIAQRLASGSRSVHMAAPYHCHGLPHWMRSWPAEGKESVVLFGTRLHSLRKLAQDAFVLNLWSGIWPAAMSAQGLEWAGKIQHSRIASMARAVEVVSLRDSVSTMIQSALPVLGGTGLRFDVCLEVVAQSLRWLAFENTGPMFGNGDSHHLRRLAVGIVHAAVKSRWEDVSLIDGTPSQVVVLRRLRTHYGVDISSGNLDAWFLNAIGATGGE
jgi:hypothetical protein